MSKKKKKVQKPVVFYGYVDSELGLGSISSQSPEGVMVSCKKSAHRGELPPYLVTITIAEV